MLTHFGIIKDPSAMKKVTILYIISCLFITFDNSPVFFSCNKIKIYLHLHNCIVRQTRTSRTSGFSFDTRLWHVFIFWRFHCIHVSYTRCLSSQTGIHKVNCVNVNLSTSLSSGTKIGAWNSKRSEKKTIAKTDGGKCLHSILFFLSDEQQRTLAALKKASNSTIISRHETHQKENSEKICAKIKAISSSSSSGRVAAVVVVDGSKRR